MEPVSQQKAHVRTRLKNLPKKPLILAGLVLALLVAARLFLTSDGVGRDESILHAVVSMTDMVVQVHSVGELDAAESVVLSSSVRGDRGKIIWLVEDGQQVSAGDLLVRLDPSNFEEEVLKLESNLKDQKTLIDAYEQLLEWEINQAEREITKAERELEVAILDLRRLEFGEGPMQMATLEGDLRKAREELDKKTGYVDSLKELEERGFANPTEIERITAEIRDAEQAHAIAEMKFTSYRDHLLPVELEKARAAIDAAEWPWSRPRRPAGSRSVRPVPNCPRPNMH